MSNLKEILTKDFLTKEYVEKGLTLKNIGDRVGCCGVTVAKYMRKNNLTIRDKNDYPRWNTGTTWEETYGKEEAEKMKIKNGVRLKQHWRDHVHPYSGKPKIHPDGCQCPFCKAKRGEWVGEGNPFYGKTHDEEYGKWKSESQLGDKNHMWRGGVSYQEYPEDFNPILKRRIRKRDQQKCIICGGGGKTVHHIDYDKNNCDVSNLITLCKKCHGRTNSNRDYWESFLTRVIRLKYYN